LTTPNSQAKELEEDKNNWVYLGGVLGAHCLLFSKKSLALVFKDKKNIVLEIEGRYGTERLLALVSNNKKFDSLKKSIVKYDKVSPGRYSEVLDNSIKWINRLYSDKELFRKDKNFYYGSLSKISIILINKKNYQLAEKYLNILESFVDSVISWNKIKKELLDFKKHRNIFLLAMN
jgi:hypothetical protein